MGGIFSSSASRKRAAEEARVGTIKQLEAIKNSLDKCQADRNEALDAIVKCSDEKGDPLPGKEAAYRSLSATLVILAQQMDVYVAFQTANQRDLMLHEVTRLMPDQAYAGKSKEEMMEDMLNKLESKQKGAASEANRAERIDDAICDMIETTRDSLEGTHANNSATNSVSSASSEIVAWRKAHQNVNKGGRKKTEKTDGNRTVRTKPGELSQRETSADEQLDRSVESISFEGIDLPRPERTIRERRKVAQLDA